MPIEPGDGVTIEYVGRFEDGSVFDTSRPEVAREHGLIEAQGVEASEYAPLSFTVGAGDIIEGIDEAIAGMTAGEEATVTVPPAKAYGEFQADRVREYDPETFEGMVGKEPEVGLHVEAENGLHGDVTAVRDDAVEVDFNHELSGKTLVFDIEVVDVR
ncbi:peptidylprolyl isomerase [Haloarcula sp. K1]|uniref:FKBP-type peptidyl-prolyl cis-trans isomerase n=1 Tax=Haloarcula sp. K1 TaxID=1622207 RepID=UPI0007BB6075|nr:peptidylprolyl isomerase [Haloarcula sp. K1]KZX48394.1 peptidylprolyl isomerase [Haloarcula sp. K1]